MRYALYNTLWRTTAPMLRRRLARHADEAALIERFHPVLPILSGAPVWMQACSVGEVNTAQPLLQLVGTAFGPGTLLLTASTLTGRARAEAAQPGFSAYFPFDHPGSVRDFITRVQPRVLVLVETELWPNVIRECNKQGIPVVVVNGRLSDKHFARYQRLRRAARPMFAGLAAVGAQTAQHAERFASLGVPADRIEVTGNLKFDAAPTEVGQKERARLRAACGIPDAAPLLLFGSTRPGDEALAAKCWLSLRAEFPNLHLLVAPRHVERRDEARACFYESVLLRSALKEGALPQGERVLLVDTLGELTQFYAAATVAVVGGSFYPGVEGHNPLEPAALGVPTVFGPHMRNFAEAASTLVQADAAVQVESADKLCGSLAELLRDNATARQMGTRARRVVLDNQGSAQKNLHLIQQVLQRGSR